MASLSLHPQFEIILMSNRNVTELILQLKNAKAHGKNYIKIKAHLVRHLLRNRLLGNEEFFPYKMEMPFRIPRGLHNSRVLSVT